jgi:hypothetical protein
VDTVHAPYFSENLVGPAIEHGTSISVARYSDHYTTEALNKPQTNSQQIALSQLTEAFSVQNLGKYIKVKLSL